jgi:DNA-binding NarL/FixJ family response regulator
LTFDDMALLFLDDEAVEAYRKIGVPGARTIPTRYQHPFSTSPQARWGWRTRLPANGATEVIRVLIADDDQRFRRVVAALLQGEESIQVVGQADDGRAAVAAALELAPDLVLLDVRMPAVDGIGAAQEIRRLLPATKVVMFTGSDDRGDVQAAIRAGANGYLLKEDLFKGVAAALRFLARGGPLLLPPSIAPELLAQPRERPKECAGLSERELEVLRLIGLGYPNQRIAAELCLSPHTVKRHVANILAKLHQRSRGEAVLHAMRVGVIASQAS